MSKFARVHPPGLSTSLLGQNFLYFDKIGSTNTWLKDNLCSLPDGTACAASLQTEGKGRLGRKWSTGKNEGLTFSFIKRDVRSGGFGALPLVTGLGVSLALDKLCGINTLIKWSNDVIADGKKLCGILCESTLSGSEGAAVTGIGVNLLNTRAGLDALGLVYATSLLLATGKAYGELETAVAILNELEPMLDIYIKEGFAPFREQYAKRCVTLNGDVVIISPDGSTKTSKALDIAEDGSLICSLNGRIEHIATGEVSVRGLYGYV